MHRIATGSVLGLSICLQSAVAQNLDTVLVASGFSRPTYLCAPIDDAHRFFVCEKNTGLIWVVEDGTVRTEPFLDLGAEISNVGERGLHGMAFHPDYANNGLFYVAYSTIEGPSLVESYTVSAGDPNVADPASATTVLPPLEQLDDFHHGGCIQFGSDGMLYISQGDGNNHLTAQDGSDLHGKMLRLDVDLPFPHIPPDNPFVGDPNVRDEIWSIGFRAPWRFSFDAATGDMYVGDVGRGTIEEVSYEAAGDGGLNYGWPCMEGTSCPGLPTPGCTCGDPGLVLPVDEYTHADLGCAVVGGYVYQGCAIPDFQGHYVYGDFCTGRVFSFMYDGVTKSPTIERTTDLDPGPHVAFNRIGSFGEDGLGEMYIVDYFDGDIFKIVPGDPYDDCNGNYLPDDCDIALGVSCDVDGNGIPDECESAEPLAYCTAKTNSCGALPFVSTSGTPSASATTGFEITGEGARATRPGLTLYSDAGRAAIAFDGGLLCVSPPVRRGVVVFSGGTPGLCDGALTVDWNAFAAGALGGNPQSFLRLPGTRVNVQWWGRDTAANGSYLSDGVEFLVCP